MCSAKSIQTCSPKRNNLISVPDYFFSECNSVYQYCELEVNISSNHLISAIRNPDSFSILFLSELFCRGRKAYMLSLQNMYYRACIDFKLATSWCNRTFIFVVTSILKGRLKSNLVTLKIYHIQYCITSNFKV